VHPYRDPPPPRPARPPAGLPSEEWFLIALLVAIGGLLVSVGIFAGSPIDAPTTIGLLGLALGLYCAVRGIPWVRRRRARRSGKLHGDRDADRAPPS